MSVIEAPESELADVSLHEVRRFSVEQYHEMVRAGLLTPDDPVELLNGWIIEKMPKNPPHRIATSETRKVLERIVPAGWFVQAQDPITTPDSEPEPDVSVVRGELRDYSDRHPGPEDVALVVEVAAASLRRDRTLKRLVYAAAGIPVYWLVNLVERRLEIYSELGGPEGLADYRRRVVFDPSEEVTLRLDDTEVGPISVAALLP